VRTRGAREVRQTPRENQHQRSESRNEKGGTQQTMPVSPSSLVSIRPARLLRADLLRGKNALVVTCRFFTCSMRRDCTSLLRAIPRRRTV